jgi:hypothetical protein
MVTNKRDERDFQNLTWQQTPYARAHEKNESLLLSHSQPRNRVLIQNIRKYKLQGKRERTGLDRTPMT